jgi:hypothetical protein
MFANDPWHNQSTINHVPMITSITSQIHTFRDNYDKAQLEYDTIWSGSNMIITAMWTLLDRVCIYR